MASPSTTKRLLHELSSYHSSPNDDDDDSSFLLHLGPISDTDLLHWQAILKGVPDTPYENGLWSLALTIPPTYPLSPPRIHFTTRICHPNISFSTGEICLTLLTAEHWTPAYTLRATLAAVHQLLRDPRPESPLNVDVAALLREGDVLGWESLVRYWTAEERWEGGGEQQRQQQRRWREEEGKGKGKERA
ncbi:ubiquitin-conjugating enzyme E2 [Emydomyces testavorans]|uniref:Ubiquitin-conjugating enzyme E2 n=1 Tax=Emydomyces testavorans TaxID=2070801 RepID=A0AAF0DH22_9EURO|nr:ubiquitin-conjugating enzyme E2 [Emydomyces testavorans]